MEWRDEIDSKEKAVIASLAALAAADLGISVDQLPEILESIARSLRGYNKELREKGAEAINEETRRLEREKGLGSSKGPDTNPFAF